MGISKQMTAVIMKQELKLYPFRITTHHKLLEFDISRRLAMCEKLHRKMEDHPSCIGKVLFSDEAHIHLNGAVCSQNNRYWGSELPDECEVKCLKGPKVTCLVALSADYGTFGPYWFESSTGATVTINSIRYCEVINKLVTDLKEKLSTHQYNRCWFMQDGARPHTANITLDLLKSHFGRRTIGQKLAFEWSPHSPDLNPLDFFFWGALKNQVYENRPTSLADIKENVEKFTRDMDLDTCKRVVANFGVRVNACFNRGGRHIEHIDYKKIA